MAGDILLGVVIGAQGLSGEVKVKTFTSAIENLRGYGPLHGKDDREFVVVSARHAKADIAVVRFKGIDDRNAAEALKGTELRVARNTLPPTQDDDERADGGDIFLPFTRETVPAVDLKASRLVIAVPEDEAAEEEHGVE
ncbi:MAG: ribosome maturation factor RimM [Rhizomicrobium sp.]